MARPRISTYQSSTQIGEVFGRLTIIGTAEPYGKKKTTRWLCRCTCGTETVVHQSALRQGAAKSCGCSRRIRWQKQITTHGRSRTPEYSNWAAMKARCNNPNGAKYADYGGRGIKVCDRWNNSFENFLADMGKRPTPKSELDRKDNNGNYEPGNVEWSDRKRQNRNRRNTPFVTIDGATRSLKEWCEVLGRNYNSVAGRVFQYGWNPVRALTTPPLWKR